jgi:hypothetical protein
MHYGKEIVATMAALEKKYETPMKIAFGIFDLTGWSWRVSHSEKYLEIEGMARGVNKAQNETHLTMAHAMALNSFYEFGAWCTSVIV